ncbi:TolC family protein [Xenophilus sp. Marseille-Q4582]|uniref:TolC family protein n=1 Tax=Xenophilus sp. Marseille-Q4582 TaxID=2866600 RepID=UPI001CE3BD24|nr:TolC family protein [Xenophilus sp. Marseille-Q4582]
MKRSRPAVPALTGLAAALLLQGPLPAGAQSPPAPPPALALSPAPRLATPSVQVSGDIHRIKQALQQLALEHPEVQSAQAAAATSGFELEAARQARYPRFKVGSATGSYNSGADGASSQSYQLVTAEARMSLIDGGAMSARVRAAEAGSLAQQEAAGSTSQKVVLDAITAYLQLQRFDLQRELAGNATRVVAELSRAEQRRVNLGAAGQNDLRMAAARQASIAARESNFAAQRDEALAKFQSYFGFAPEPRRLPVLATPESWVIDSQAEALRRAESRSTELAEGRGRVQKAEALVEQQEASVWPTVEAVVVKTKDPRGVSPSEPTRAALELNWNFGSGFDRQLRVKSALAEVENQRAKLESAQRALFEATASAWGRAQSGRERERQLLEAVRESGEAFRGRRRLLEFGRETLPNVLDAQLDYYTLLQDYIDAVFDQRITEFRLARATGELRVQPDMHNPWVDRVFGSQSGPLLDEEGVLGLECVAGNRTVCPPRRALGLGRSAGSGTPLALRAEGRLRTR